MAYTPPVADAIDFTITDGYTPPATDAVDFDMSNAGGGGGQSPIPIIMQNMNQFEGGSYL